MERVAWSFKLEFSYHWKNQGRTKIFWNGDVMTKDKCLLIRHTQSLSLSFFFLLNQWRLLSEFCGFCKHVWNLPSQDFGVFCLKEFKIVYKDLHVHLENKPFKTSIIRAKKILMFHLPLFCFRELYLDSMQGPISSKNRKENSTLYRLRFWRGFSSLLHRPYAHISSEELQEVHWIWQVL